MSDSLRPSAAEDKSEMGWASAERRYFGSLCQDANLANFPCAMAEDVITRAQLSSLNSYQAPPLSPELELLETTRILVERPSLLLSGTYYGQLAFILTSNWECDRLSARLTG